MPGNFEKELQIKFHEIALPTPWIIQYSNYSKWIKVKRKQGYCDCDCQDCIFDRNVIVLLVKRQLTPPHIGRSVYLHSYPRDSLNRRGQKKERGERERESKELYK